MRRAILKAILTAWLSALGQPSVPPLPHFPWPIKNEEDPSKMNKGFYVKKSKAVTIAHCLKIRRERQTLCKHLDGTDVNGIKREDAGVASQRLVLGVEAILQKNLPTQVVMSKATQTKESDLKAKRELHDILVHNLQFGTKAKSSTSRVPQFARQNGPVPRQTPFWAKKRQ